jgi:hypothetical protein
MYADSGHYHEYSLALIEGKVYDKGIPFHPPLFAWLLSAFYWLMGVPTHTAYPYKICLAALNALTVALAWLWWKRALGSPWHWLGAAWLAFHFGWLVFSATYDNEVPYAFFLTATAAIAWLKAPDFDPKSAVLLGLCMGLGSLTRPEHLILWPLILPYLWLRRAPHLSAGTSLARLAIAMAISAAVIAPWTIRNYRAIGAFNEENPEMEPLPRFAPVTAYSGPLNFAIANCSSADGGFDSTLIDTTGGMIDLTSPSQRRLFVHGYSQGMQWLSSHPKDAFILMTRKLNRWLDGLRIGWGVNNWPAGLTGTRPPVDMFVPEGGGALKLFLAVALAAGMFLSLLRGYRAYSICTLIVLHRVLVTLMFFGFARGMIVILPACIPLILLPWIYLAERMNLPRQKLIWLPAVASILFLLQALAVAQHTRDFLLRGPIDPATGRVMQDEPVGIRPLEPQ